MQLGIVIGQATSTIKHRSLKGWRLAVVQLLNAGGSAEGDCVVAADGWGAGVGERVILNSDGRRAREVIGDEKSPVRWVVVGVEEI